MPGNFTKPPRVNRNTFIQGRPRLQPATFGGTEVITPSKYNAAGVLWRWNGVDVSQFETVSSYLTIVGGGGASPGSGPEISFQDYGPTHVGNSVLVDCSVASPPGGLHFYFFKILDMPTLPERYNFQYRIRRDGNDVNTWIGFVRGSYVSGISGETPVATGMAWRLGISPQVSSVYVDYAATPLVGDNLNSGAAFVAGGEGNTIQERYVWNPYEAGAVPAFRCSSVPVDGDGGTNTPAIAGFTGPVGIGTEWTGLPITDYWLVVRAGTVNTIEFSELVITKHEYDL